MTTVADGLTVSSNKASPSEIKRRTENDLSNVVRKLSFRHSIRHSKPTSKRLQQSKKRSQNSKIWLSQLTKVCPKQLLSLKAKRTIFPSYWNATGNSKPLDLSNVFHVSQETSEKSQKNIGLKPKSNLTHDSDVSTCRKKRNFKSRFHGSKDESHISKITETPSKDEQKE